MTQNVLLIGAGHAHIEVIRNWGVETPDLAQLTVIDPHSRPIYSGMVPGYVAGQYERRDLEIDLESLCRRACAVYVQSSVSAIDATAQHVTCLDGSRVNYDIASFDIGSSVAGKELPGVDEHALPSRPIGRFLDHLNLLTEKSLSSSTELAPVHVIGGGAGGVELAFCLEARLRARAGDIPNPRVAIVTRGAHPLEGSARSAIAAVEKQALQRGIRVHCNVRVASLGEDCVELEGGHKLASSGVLWVTGPAPHAAASAFDLPKDAGGYFEIDATFRIKGQQNVFAVGDCASLAGMKKSGVFAVRAGPILDANLRARLSDKPLRPYKPQRDFLSLLNLGNGEAIGTKWGVTLRGVRVMQLKDRIDRAFMKKYR